MNLYLETIVNYPNLYLYPLFRVMGLIMAMPIFGSNLLPNKIKVLIGVALTVVIAPNVQLNQHIEIFSATGIVIAINQVLIGIVFGLVIHVIFQTFVLAGQLVAQQMGLGFAQMMDPQNGVSVPAVGQLYMMIVTLLFISINGHLTVIRILADSFVTIPVGFDSVKFTGLDQMVGWGGWMFKSALKMAIPAITALFVVNISFGVMTKAAPQLNIFSIGFPATMLIGIIILWFAIGTLMPGFDELTILTYDRLESFAGIGGE